MGVHCAIMVNTVEVTDLFIALSPQMKEAEASRIRVTRVLDYNNNK